MTISTGFTLACLALFSFQFLTMLLEGRSWLFTSCLVLANICLLIAFATAQTTLWSVVATNPVIWVGGIICLSLGLLGLIRMSIDKAEGYVSS